MKKIITLTALLCAMTFYGQRQVTEKIGQLIAQGVEFKEFSPFIVNSHYPEKKVVSNATYATVNLDVVQNIAASKYDGIEISVPYNNTVITVQLYKVEILAEGFHLDTDKQTFAEFEKGAHYRGIIKNDPMSVVAFNFFNGEMNGIISAAQYSNIVVGRLQEAGNFSDYIIYSDANLNVVNDFVCTTVEPEPRAFKQKSTNNTNNTNSLRCVTVYFEVDFDLFLANDFDVIQTNNWMASVFNNVQTLYANEGITTTLKSIFIWTSPDPYEGETSADYLFQFNDVRPVFDGDVGQLVGIDEGGLGGVAVNIAGLCSQDNFSYSDVNFEFDAVPVFSWTVQVITHELGHLYGSPHTHGCYWNGNNTAIDGCGTSEGFVEGSCNIGPIPGSSVQGTIMSYCHLVAGIGINFANGFGPQPAASILNHVENSSCLSTDCVNTCINTVASMATTSATEDSAIITWTDQISDGPWLVAIAPVDGVFTTWETSITNTFAVTGLDPNTYYKFGVRSVCEDPSATGNATELIFATGGDYCGGLSFTDTGGEFGNYANEEYLVKTITPNVADNKAVVTFTEFDIEFNFDFMIVYDGPNIGAPSLGAFTGNTIPGPFTSSAADGSLTFEFFSDQNETASGWKATVSCASLSVNDNTFTGFRYYPNPANNIVNITAGEEIKEVYIHNVAGQLLMHKVINNTETAVDISSFAVGVYFFRVSSGNREANFRIIKQ